MYIDLQGIKRLTDDVGIIQHSIYDIPDRNHGYCIDDNARALMLLNVSNQYDDEWKLRNTYKAFIQHAWNPDKLRFRNFMSYDRRWIEEVGSDDSHARTLWALSTCKDKWSFELFQKAIIPAMHFKSLRSKAFTILALCNFIKRNNYWDYENKVKQLVSDFKLGSNGWFEDYLSYDNARLSQALLEAGKLLENKDYVEIGVDSFYTLLNKQVSLDEEKFIVWATQDFGSWKKTSDFDQQPVDIWATLDCIVSINKNAYREIAEDYYNSFSGYWGYDGITAKGPNKNKGAESILSHQFANLAMKKIQLQNWSK